MVNKDLNTEKKILDAAKRVFEKKGMYGARMQEIADEAGINKALLHYYYRSKEKLFDAVFVGAFQEFFPNLMQLLDSEIDIKIRLEKVVDHYVNLIHSNPFLPIFIITEVNRDAHRIKELMSNAGMNPQAIITKIHKLQSNGHLIPDIDPRHIIVNLISMTVFPHLSRPLMQPMLFDDNKEAYDTFLSERKGIIMQMILKTFGTVNN